jgi:hypothetical protein
MKRRTKKGTKPHPFIQPTYDIAKQKITHDHRRIVRSLMVLGIIIGLAVVAVVVKDTLTSNKNAKTTSSAQPISLPSATTKSGLDPRFIQQDVGVGALYRVIGTGLSGHTAKEFTASVLRFSGHSAQALAIYANAVHLWPNPNNTNGLLTSNRTYLSTKGIMLWASLQGALMAKGTGKTVGQAPSNWYNTGVDGGKFGRSAVAGISGNRTSLIVTFKDGSKVVIMRRCGNLALPSKGTVPIVKTELQPKNWRLDPAAQGKAPVGGGKNQDPGPGTYTKKPAKPGSKPYTPPPTPKPSVSVSLTTIPGGSTPDPAPTPSPEPSAPTPTNPGGSAPPIPEG